MREHLINLAITIGIVVLLGAALTYELLAQAIILLLFVGLIFTFVSLIRSKN